MSLLPRATLHSDSEQLLRTYDAGILHEKNALIYNGPFNFSGNLL
jgi:hypothetical protein